jgi:hypothetical protein
MHLAILPGLWVALALGLWGGQAAPPEMVASLRSVSSTFLDFSGNYSIAAQATETATTTLATPTVALTSTAEVTSTAAVTSTASITTTAVQNTPAPLSTVTPQGSLRLNPFDWTFLTSVASPPLGPFGWAYLAIMLGLFATSAYFYFVKRNEWKRTNSVLKRAADRWAGMGLWIGGVGLLLALFRLISLDPFNIRLWLYLWLLVALAAGGWFYYWYRTSYPRQMAKYLKTQRARQYMPASGKKGSARPPATTQTQRGNPPRPAPVAKPQTTATTSEQPATGPVATSPAPQPRPGGSQRRRRRR